MEQISNEVEDKVLKTTALPKASTKRKAEAACLMKQEVLNLVASKHLETENLKTQPFVLYLWNKRKVRIVGVEVGSLIITLEITSLESIEGLWMDYCTGYLNEMAQKFLVTEEILKELDITMVTLTITIQEQEYRNCLECLSCNSSGTNLRICQLSS